MESLVPNHHRNQSITSCCSNQDEEKNPLQNPMALEQQQQLPTTSPIKDQSKQCSFSWYDSDDDDDSSSSSYDEFSHFLDVSDSSFESDLFDDFLLENENHDDCNESWLHLHSINQSWASLHDSSSTCRRSKKRKIKFTNVEIREYALTIGDHPFCEEGVPLSLDWKHNPKLTVVDVDTFMEQKKRESSLSQDEESLEQLCHYQYLPEPPKRLSPDERKERLIAVSGFSKEQLETAETERTNELEMEWESQCQTSSAHYVE